MSEAQSPDEQQIKCPWCGEPVTRTNAADLDASVHEQIEFTCPNRRRRTGGRRSKSGASEGRADWAVLR